MSYHNTEQLEAMQVDANHQLLEYKKTLTPIAFEAMQKMEECVAFHEKNCIPIVTFARYTSNHGFYQWNSFNTPENPDRFSKDYIPNSWITIGILVRQMSVFISRIYAVRLKLWSLTANAIIFDTHPPKDEMDDSK
jgi:hypothetical protein